MPPGGGAPELLIDRHMFDQPNGVALLARRASALRRTDTVQMLIRVFDVSTYGSLMNGRVFASGIVSEREPGVPDGMKCDSRGNVWVTAPGGVWVYAPSGELIGKVRVPELVANLAWGGPDFRTLFMCATHSVYSVKTKVGPRLEPYMRARSGGTSNRTAGSATASASSASSTTAGTDVFVTAAAEPTAAQGSQPPGPEPLRPHHPGHAERCRHGGGRLCLIRVAGALQAAERDCQRHATCGDVPPARRDGDPRLVRGRARRARA